LSAKPRPAAGSGGVFSFWGRKGLVSSGHLQTAKPQLKRPWRPSPNRSIRNIHANKSNQQKTGAAPEFQ
jgi:hypothetical protein